MSKPALSLLELKTRIRNAFETSNPNLSNLLCRIIDDPKESLSPEDAEIITNSTDSQQIALLNLLNSNVSLTTEEVRDALLKLTDSTNEEVQKLVVQVIAGIAWQFGVRELLKTAETRDALLKLAGSTNEEVQQMAVGVIGNIGLNAKELFATEETRAVVMKLLVSTNEEARTQAATAIATIAAMSDKGGELFTTIETRDALLKLAVSKDEGAQQMAAAAIRSIVWHKKEHFATEESRDVLLKLADSTNEEVQKLAAEVIENITRSYKGGEHFATEESRVVLLKLANSTNEAVQKLAAEVIENIARFKKGGELFATEETRAVLLKLANSTNKGAHRQAVSAIANIGIGCTEGKKLFTTAETRDVLLKLADSTDEESQSKAAWAIANIATHEKGKELFATAETRDVLLKLANSTNVEVQSQALRAIVNIAVHEKGEEFFATAETRDVLLKLADSTDEKIQREATWAIANSAVYEKGKKLFATEETVVVLLKLTNSTNVEVQSQVSWAIGNITFDCEEGEGLFATAEIRDILLKLVNSMTDEEYQKRSARALEIISKVIAEKSLEVKSESPSESQTEVANSPSSNLQTNDEKFEVSISVLTQRQEELQQKYDLLTRQLALLTLQHKDSKQKVEEIEADLSGKISAEDHAAKNSDLEQQQEEIKQQQQKIALEIESILTAQQKGLRDQHDLLTQQIALLAIEQEKLKQEALETTHDLSGKVSAKDHAAENLKLEQQQQEIRQQQQGITSKIESIEESISALHETTTDSAKRLGVFDLSKMSPWIQNLNLNEAQVEALNNMSESQLKAINEADFKDIYDQLQDLDGILSSQQAQQKVQQERIKGLINIHHINQDKNEPYREQLELEKEPALKQAAVKIQAQFNAGFFVAVGIKTGKFQGSQGKIAASFESVSILLEPLPFGSTVAGLASSALAYLGEARRENRYSRIIEIFGENDLVAGSVLAEKIGRKIVLTAQVKIRRELEQLKDEGKEAYCNNLAKACLESVLNGEVGKRLAAIGNTKPSEDDLIKMIGAAAGVIHIDHSLYKIPAELVAKESAESLVQTSVGGADNSAGIGGVHILSEMVKMREMIEALVKQNAVLEARIVTLERNQMQNQASAVPGAAPNPQVGHNVVSGVKQFFVKR